MKKWTLESTWDDLMARLDELERFILPYKMVAIFKGGSVNGYPYCELDTQIDAYFSYSIERYYCKVQVWFQESGHILPFKDNYVAIASVPRPAHSLIYRDGKCFASMKEAVVFIINEWEEYIGQKKYENDYILFRHACFGYTGIK